MGRKLISHPSWIIILGISLIISERGKATLDIKPTNTVVLLTGATFFNCSTFNSSNSSEEIAWYHYSVGSDQRKGVYYDGDIYTDYQGRFRVENDLSKGIANLIIQTATLEDAGRYECQDRKGFGETASGQLNVLETKPVCQPNIHPEGVVGSNDCGIPPDQVELSCSLAYRGNIPVELDWRNGLEKDSSSMAVKCSNTTNHSTCNLTVAGDRIRNNSVYICQTKDTVLGTYNCSTDAIRILYVISDNKTISKTDQDNVSCSANSSQQCTYTWYHGDKSVSTSEILKHPGNGQFICKANCKLRGQDCLVIARNLNVSVESTVEEPSNAGLVIGFIVAFIIAVIISVIAIVAWRQCRQKNKPTGNARELERINSEASEIRDNNTVPTVSQSSVDSPDTVSVQDGIEKIYLRAPYIDKGLSGEIHGPEQYNDIRSCAFEKIMCPAEQQLPPKDGKMTKEEKVCKKAKDWMKLKHCNLIQFYEVFLQRPAVFIVMEYATARSVRTVLNNCAENLPESAVINWATQVAAGMNHLHDKNIIHKGLKCAQVLIMEEFDPSRLTFADVTLKVASYSLTSELNTSNQVTFHGMFKWMAPEALSTGNHTLNSDIWSYGVTVWEILTKESPHRDASYNQIFTGIPSGELSLKIPESCTEVLCGILNDCFEKDPGRRPAFGEILNRLRLTD